MYDKNRKDTRYNPPGNQNRGPAKPGFQHGKSEAKKTAAQLLKEVTPVCQSLSKEYGSKPEIFLESGYLYETASQLKNLTTHQLRKVLDVTKEALAIARSGKKFTEAQKRLFILLPMMAYNTGRAPKEKKDDYQKLLEFVYKNINEDSIQATEDIITFDQMITSVVAYHKFLGGKVNAK